MSLQKRTIPLNLTSGIDTKSDEKLSVKMSIMENCSHQGKGTPRKRNEIISLSKNIEGGGALNSGKYSFGYKNQALMATNNSVYAFIESTSEWKKIQDISLSTLSGNFVGKAKDDAILSGMVRTATEDAHIVSSASDSKGFVYVYDKESGILKSSLNVGKFPRLISLNGEIISLSVDFPTTQIRYINHTTVNQTIPIAGSDGVFDIAAGDAHIYSIHTDSGGNEIVITKINQDGTVDSDVSIALGGDTVEPTSNPSIFFDGVNLHATFIVNRGAAKFVLYTSTDQDLVTITAKTDFFVFPSGASLFVMSSIATGESRKTTSGNKSLYMSYTVVNLGVYGTVELSLSDFTIFQNPELRNIGIASKPFAYEDSVFTLVKQGLTENVNWILIDSDYNPQGMINNFDTTIISGVSSLASLNSVTSDYSISYIDDNNFIKRADIDFSYEKSGDFVEFGESTFLSGSLPLRYNGEKLIESQFLSRPSISLIGINAGAEIPAGTYDYIATYEYSEPNGNIIRSEPSESSQIVLGAPGNTGISILSIQITNLEDAEIKLRVYRKEVSETVYRLVDEFALNNRAVLLTVVNDLTTDLSGKEALYTTGGNLPNQTMPAITAYGFSNNRLFGVRSEDANEIMFSKKYIIGEGIFFNNFQTLNVEDNQGRRADRINTLAGMDNKLIILKRNSILAMFGDGPDGAGLNGEFSEPELVTTDAGCVNARSLSMTDKGLVFKSKKGIHMLTRGMGSTYLGAPAEGFNGLNISGAILMEDIDQVRWTTSDGVAIVYDYYYEQWSVFKNHESTSCFIYKGKMSILKSDGSFLVEGENYSDDGTFITQKITTGWLKAGGVSANGSSTAAGPQEFQRVYRMLILGEYKSLHKMLVKVYYDYHDYPDHEYLLTPTDLEYERQDKPTIEDIENGGNDGTYQYKVNLRKQKCQAIKISIEDVEDGIIGESYQLTDVTFVVGKKKGAFKTRQGVSN